MSEVQTLRLGDAGIVSEEDARVSFSVISALRIQVARGLTTGSRLHIHVLPVREVVSAAPKDTPTVNLRKDQLVLEIETVGGNAAVIANLVAAARELPFRCRVVHREPATPS